MLDKAQYYHGAAIMALLEHNQFSVKKMGTLGYVVNDKVFAFLKYTTKNKTPWQFSFDQEDVDRCVKMASSHKALVVGLVCGGDGICALTWDEVKMLLNSKPGRISTKRKHNESYGVVGSQGELKRKIAVGRWPTLVSEIII